MGGLSFAIQHNREEAARQEYALARRHFDEVNARRNVFNPDHTKRFRDARDRLNRARDMLLDLAREDE